MGGFGSGRRYNSKSTTEGQHSIDIRWLKKHGHLRPGNIGSLSWSVRGEQTGSIGYRMEANRMILNYRHRPYGGEWEPVEQTITFSRSSCNYGGYRTWLLCPRCGQRVAALYGAGKYFFCRHCHDLTYASQQEDRSDRLMRKASKSRERLGVNGPLSEPILYKPKHMHQNTFDRLRLNANVAEYWAFQIIGRQFGIKV